jgi:hypothetical protein
MKKGLIISGIVAAGLSVATGIVLLVRSALKNRAAKKPAEQPAG